MPNSKTYKDANRQKIRAWGRKASKRYRASHRSELRESTRRYRRSHSEQYRGYDRARYARNPIPKRSRNAAYLKTVRGSQLQVDKTRRRRASKLQMNGLPSGELLTRGQWEKILRLANGRCYWRISPNCPNRNGKRMTNPTQDHIIPLTKGGFHTESNVVAACRFCNSVKHDNILTLF